MLIVSSCEMDFEIGLIKMEIWVRMWEDMSQGRHKEKDCCKCQSLEVVIKFF